MHFFRTITLTVMGLMGLFTVHNLVGTNNSAVETNNPNDLSEETKSKFEEDLLDRLDVDQFQERHDMLVATNHIT